MNQVNENNQKKYGFGIDIGGTTCKIGLFKLDGTLIEKWQIKTNLEDNGSYILEDIAVAIENKLDEKGISIDEIHGAGVGVPGPVMEDGTVIKCVNLNWDIVPVTRIMSDRLSIPVKAENDANVAALGEMWQGGGEGYRNVVMVTLGTGIGGGIIHNGKIISGAFGASGEIGHIQMQKCEQEICGCGKKGCLEQYASATGIVRKAKSMLMTNNKETSLRNYKELSAKNIFDEAKAGDRLALELIESLGEMLGIALSYISCVVDPDIYVIGGGVSKAGKILIEVIQKYFQKTAFHASRKARFTLATLGNDAGIYGALKLLL